MPRSTASSATPSRAPGQVTLLVGPARSGKTAQLLAGYRERLANSPPGSCLWIAPSSRALRQVREQLLTADFSACLHPGITTFDHLARQLLAASDQPARLLEPLAQQMLVAQLIAEAHEAGHLRYFAPIADRPGLASLCLEFIRELKRLEVWPEHFAAATKRQRGGPSAKDRELLLLYEAYQRQLLDHQLFDAEGCFWLARDLLANGHLGPVAEVRYLVVDGFTDFTRTQHELLAALSGQTDHLLITLPLDNSPDAPPSRQKLFTKPLQTLEQLRRWAPQLQVVSLAAYEPGESWPAAIHYLERQLFGNPRHRPKPPTCEGIEILAAARPLDEFESVARQVKQLLTHGDPVDRRRVRAEEIVVVVRNLAPVATLLEEVFAEYGVNVILETGLPLCRARAFATLVALLRLAQEDWPFRALVALLSNGYLQPRHASWDSTHRVAAERMIRDLQISSGRARLLEALQRLAQRTLPADQSDDPDDDSLARRRARILAARQTHEALELLSRTLTALPAKATARRWAEALLSGTGSLVAQLGISEAVDALLKDEPDLAIRDRTALGMIAEALAALDDAWTDLGQPARELTLAELIEFLGQLGQNQRLRQRFDEAGRVRVLSAVSIRTLRVDYLFVVGLSEKAFPPAEREDRLYGAMELEQFAAAGLPLPHEDDRMADEMLLFYEVLTRASRRLYLSYPGLDPKAQPLLPSPYLAEIVRMFKEANLTQRTVTDLKPLPPVDEPHSPTEARVLAVHRAVDHSGERHDAALLAALSRSATTSDALGTILSGLRLITARGGQQTELGPYEGLLTSPEALAALAEHFSEDRPWSASKLEEYGTCPFRFFARNLLHLEPLPTLALETDHASRGRLAHAVLRQLHRQLVDEQGRPLPPSRLEQTDLQRRIARLVDEVSVPRSGEAALMAALDTIDRGTLATWLMSYAAQHENYDQKQSKRGAQLVGTYFEVSFGLPLGKPRDAESGSDTSAAEKTDADSSEHSPATLVAEAISRAEPLRLSIHGLTVLLSGRIDRIDLGEVSGRLVFEVLDYKTGSRTPVNAKEVAEGRALQLALYALAVEELLLAHREALAWGIGYWLVRDSGFRDMLSMAQQDEGEVRPTDQWLATREALLERIWSLVQGIRGGQFAVFNPDENCTGTCDYHAICRIGQIRALEKRWQPPQPST